MRTFQISADKIIQGNERISAEKIYSVILPATSIPEVGIQF
jgi:hypothetical protein